MRIQRLVITTFLLLTMGMTYAATGTIDPNAKYGYSENAGFINFAPADGGVTVTRAGLSGFAWCRGAGWIKLGSGNDGPYANTNANDWGVNVLFNTPEPGGGTLSGYGWSESSGWINFAPKDGGVTFGADGILDGYAWSRTMGFIRFDRTSSISVKTALAPLFVSGPSVDGAATFSGLEGTFTAMTDIPGAIITWDFGDGSPPMTGNSVTHMYAAPGTYLVTISAVANGISTSVTMWVTVIDPADGTVLPGTLAIKIIRGYIRIYPSTMRLYGTVNFPAGTKVANSSLTLTANGFDDTFSLNSHGIARSASGKAKFSVKPSRTGATRFVIYEHGTGLAAKLAQKFRLDSQNRPTRIMLELTLEKQCGSYVAPLKYITANYPGFARFGHK